MSKSSGSAAEKERCGECAQEIGLGEYLNVGDPVFPGKMVCGECNWHVIAHRYKQSSKDPTLQNVGTVRLAGCMKRSLVAAKREMASGESFDDTAHRSDWTPAYHYGDCGNETDDGYGNGDKQSKCECCKGLWGDTENSCNICLRTFMIVQSSENCTNEDQDDDKDVDDSSAPGHPDQEGGVNPGLPPAHEVELHSEELDQPSMWQAAMLSQGE